MRDPPLSKTSSTSTLYFFQVPASIVTHDGVEPGPKVGKATRSLSAAHTRPVQQSHKETRIRNQRAKVMNVYLAEEFPVTLRPVLIEWSLLTPSKVPM